MGESAEHAAAVELFALGEEEKSKLLFIHRSNLTGDSIPRKTSNVHPHDTLLTFDEINFMEMRPILGTHARFY